MDGPSKKQKIQAFCSGHLYCAHTRPNTFEALFCTYTVEGRKDVCMQFIVGLLALREENYV